MKILIGRERSGRSLALDAGIITSKVSSKILGAFGPLVRQAKLDVSHQLKGTDHGNYSFAM
jgi:hypothetical protein